MSITDHDYEDIMNSNKVISLEHRRKVNDVLFLYKLLNNQAVLPEYLENITFRTNSRNTRNKTLLVEQYCTRNYSFAKPSNRMVRLFNLAAQNDQTIDPFCDSISSFKQKLLSINNL